MLSGKISLEDATLRSRGSVEEKGRGICLAHPPTPDRLLSEFFFFGNVLFQFRQQPLGLNVSELTFLGTKIVGDLEQGARDIHILFEGTATAIS